MIAVSPLRYRLEHSRALAWVLALLFGSYLRFCNWTTRWTVQGLDELKADLTEGPVLLVMWHERSMMGPVHWPVKHGQLSSLYASSPIGRVSGAMQRQFGLQPMEMADGQSNVAASREILKRVRAGVSIGMTGDGPLGPALEVQDAPLDWARAMQRPVYGYAFATRRHRLLKSWDKMMMPLPFTKGAVVFARWEHEVARKAELGDIGTARRSIVALLNRVNVRADKRLEK